MIIKTQDDWWTLLEANWDNILKIFETVGASPSIAIQARDNKEGLRLAMQLNTVWGMAPDDPIIHTWPSWGNLCDLCGEGWVFHASGEVDDPPKTEERIPFATSAFKQFLIIYPDGTTEPQVPASRGLLPSLDEMQAVVEGTVEFVNTLRSDLPGFTYTYMVVNDMGLKTGLPRNQKATDLYLANIKRQFPDSPSPSKEATSRFEQGLKDAGIVPMAIMDLNPPGYEDDPYVCGTVLLFDGYTKDELLAMGL